MDTTPLWGLQETWSSLRRWEGYLQVALGYLFILCFNRSLVWRCFPSGGAAGTDESCDRTEDKREERGQFRYMTDSLCS